VSRLLEQRSEFRLNTFAVGPPCKLVLDATNRMSEAPAEGYASIAEYIKAQTAEALETRRAEAHEGFVELIARAKATGHLREDFASEDLVILLMANAGVIADRPLPRWLDVEDPARGGRIG
jgi:hypothetical protein